MSSVFKSGNGNFFLFTLKRCIYNRIYYVSEMGNTSGGLVQLNTDGSSKGVWDCMCENKTERQRDRERLKNIRIWYYAAHSVMQYKSPIYRTGISLSLDQFRQETKTNSLTGLLTTLNRLTARNQSLNTCFQ